MRKIKGRRHDRSVSVFRLSGRRAGARARRAWRRLARCRAAEPRSGPGTTTKPSARPPPPPRVPLRDLTELDWREPVSFVIEHTIPHGHGGRASAGRRRQSGRLRGHRRYRIAGTGAARCWLCRDCLAQSGDSLRSICSAMCFRFPGARRRSAAMPAVRCSSLYPLEFGGIYVLDMPPARAELTLSITFDAAVFLDLGNGAWPPCARRARKPSPPAAGCFIARPARRARSSMSTMRTGGASTTISPPNVIRS